MGRVHVVQFGSVLVATLADELDDDSALAMQDEVSTLVLDRRATGVLLDISALEIVDSFISKIIGDTARIVRILGAEVAIVGMRPAVAITLVELGLSLDGIATALSIDAGLALLTRAEHSQARIERARADPLR